MGTNPRIVISGVTIDVLDQRQTVELVEKYITEQTPLHLMGVNADKINAANRDPALKAIVNSCGIINADGISVVMASRFLGEPLPERVAGVDLMLSLVKLSAEKQYPVFLLGARQEVVEKAGEKLLEQYPGLTVAGIRNGYFSREEWPEISRQLRSCSPRLVFVGITSPLKEQLIEYLQNDGHTCVFMGVGGSFDVISGLIPRAPLWMQKWGLEWLFRVIQEPRRLFKRYFIGNTQFVWTILKEKCRGNS